MGSSENFTLCNFTYPANSSSTTTSNEYGHTSIFEPETSIRIQLVLQGILLTIVALTGIMGNILTILVLSQKRIHASLSVLLAGLSLCDLFVCLLFLIVKGLPALFGYWKVWKGYVGWICEIKKFLFPCLQTVQLGSTYFTVAITFERFIAVFRPLENKRICTRKRALQASGLIAIFSVAANSLMFYTVIKRTEIYNSENDTCKSLPAKDIPQFVIHLRLAIYVVVHYLVPLITVIATNAVIMKKIHLNNQRRGSFTQNQIKEIKLTNMLIVVVAVYIICNIFRVTNSFTHNIFGKTYAELVELTDFLIVVNSAVNYIIYCAYGQAFRDGFKSVFSSTCCQRRGSGDPEMEEVNANGTMAEMVFESVRKVSKDVISGFGKFGSQKRVEVRP